MVNFFLNYCEINYKEMEFLKLFPLAEICFDENNELAISDKFKNKLIGILYYLNLILEKIIIRKFK